MENEYNVNYVIYGMRTVSAENQEEAEKMVTEALDRDKTSSEDANMSIEISSVELSS